MRGVPVALIYAVKKNFNSSNRKFLNNFLIVLGVLFVVYTLLFQAFMAYEGRDYSFITGIYWTLVVMSTQGFGDIVFNSDAGKLFTMVVNITGILFLLVMLPFVVIEFIYNPLVRAQKEASTPRRLPETMRGHVIITHYDAIAEALIVRLEQHHIAYAVIVEELNEAYMLADRGVKIMVGSLTQRETYEAAQIRNASLVSVTSASDPINTNIVFTIRQVCEDVPIVSFANSQDAIDILELAGSTKVLDLGTLLGGAIAHSTSDALGGAHELSQISDLLIVEARAAGTSLVGQTLKQADLGHKMNITVVGIWHRGNFELAGPNTLIRENSILVMAVSEDQKKAFNEEFCRKTSVCNNSVVILGAGRVGYATAKSLNEKGIPFTVIDHDPEAIELMKEFGANTVIGDAADLNFLKTTNFFDASTILVTTHDDDINIYLTLYFRRLRPEVQLLARAGHEHNVTTLHRAGADFVFSSSTMASIELFNQLEQGRFYTMVEGLFAKRVKAPEKMIGKSLVNLQFRALTGCSVIAIIKDEVCHINPSPFEPIEPNCELIMVFTPEAEEKYMKFFG